MAEVAPPTHNKKARTNTRDQENRGPREQKDREPRERREPREPREHREPRQPREAKEPRSPREKRERDPLPTYDFTSVEVLPEVPLPRPPKVQKPNKDNLEAAKTRIEGEIDNLKRQIESIDREIDNVRSNRTTGSGEKKEAFAALKEIQSTFNAANSTKDQLKNEVNELEETVKRASEAVAKIRGTSQFSNEEQLDQEIAKLQRRIKTETLSLANETRVVREIESLQRAKGSFSQIAAAQANVSDLQNQFKIKRGELQRQKAECSNLFEQVQVSWTCHKYKIQFMYTCILNRLPVNVLTN